MYVRERKGRQGSKSFKHLLWAPNNHKNTGTQLAPGQLKIEKKGKTELVQTMP